MWKILLMTMFLLLFLCWYRRNYTVCTIFFIRKNYIICLYDMKMLTAFSQRLCISANHKPARKFSPWICQVYIGWMDGWMNMWDRRHRVCRSNAHCLSSWIFLLIQRLNNWSWDFSVFIRFQEIHPQEHSNGRIFFCSTVIITAVEIKFPVSVRIRVRYHWATVPVSSQVYINVCVRN